MKRLVRLVILYLVGGATAAIALAQACAIWSPLGDDRLMWVRLDRAMDGSVTTTWTPTEPRRAAEQVLNEFLAGTLSPATNEPALVYCGRRTGFGVPVVTVRVDRGRDASTGAVWIRHRAGWPFAAFECVVKDPRPAAAAPGLVDPAGWEGGATAHIWPSPRLAEGFWLTKLTYTRPLPTRPLWRGLIADSLVMAGLLGGVHTGLVGLRRLRRRRRGRCAGCGYDVAGVTAGECPECGARLAQGTESAG